MVERKRPHAANSQNGKLVKGNNRLQFPVPCSAAVHGAAGALCAIDTAPAPPQPKYTQLTIVQLVPSCSTAALQHTLCCSALQWCDGRQCTLHTAEPWECPVTLVWIQVCGVVSTRDTVTRKYFVIFSSLIFLSDQLVENLNDWSLT